MSFWCHFLYQKTNENTVRIFALKVFIASLGLPGSFWGLTKSPGSLKRLQKIPGQNPYISFVFLFQTMTPKKTF
jgi:hypothetical protein